MACDAARGEDMGLGAPRRDVEPVLADRVAIPARPVPRFSRDARGRRVVVTGAFCGDPPPGRRAANEAFVPVAGEPLPGRVIRHPKV